MILGVNGIRLVVKRSGVARCLEALLRCFGELEHPFSQIRVYTPRPLEKDIYLPPNTENVVLPSSLPLGAWEQLILPKAHGSRNLLLCPSYVVPLMARCPTFLIHHGSYEGYPQAFDWWTRKKMRAIYALSARRASGLSTVSQSSKGDMVRFYGIDPDKINVIPEGVDTKLFRPIDDPERMSRWRRENLKENAPFVVYVGKPNKRRNISALIRAFAELKKEGFPHKLLIVGAGLPGASPFRQVIDELKIRTEVFVLDYATHEEMFLIYNAASLLVYPSSYEGFGMPVLEAMACGTPVIALDNTAFPEFAGGVAHLLKDAEVSTLKEGMTRVLSDSEWRRQMSEDGPKRAAAYDWSILSRKYLDLMIPLAVS
jgi:glycosyltransferase involved in cell wall biosynthesis